MTLRLYFDEDSMDQALIRALKVRGVDVETAWTAAMLRRSDLEQLSYATREERVLYSFNVGDFCRLHTRLLAEGNGHAGLILAQQGRFSVGDQLRRLLRIVATLAPEEIRNRLEFLGAW